ncbi:gamma-glutamylcyclotransferase [Cyanobium sp. BA5m-10]|uniref:gamma-glutamylcyclotransferase family protein n=1 Tax=Cyanobium sp. BA5m-10 TaxID=2823705 RepID=UPI0020CCFE46|nr:gamma-glutamylcyclotransferase [Cyanobium sp. BA5m-10]MCP9905430.1 gamma-glutamylcyclotransferase [Cyanobium sp. BA5m-10]
MTTVFIYGSLKRGQPNHHRLASATSLGEGQFEGVQLFDLGPFPMTVRHPGEPASPGSKALQG